MGLVHAFKSIQKNSKGEPPAEEDFRTESLVRLNVRALFLLLISLFVFCNGASEI